MRASAIIASTQRIPSFFFLRWFDSSWVMEESDFANKTDQDPESIDSRVHEAQR